MLLFVSNNMHRFQEIQQILKEFAIPIAFHKQEMEAFKGTVSNEDSSAASTGEVSESTEENKKVLG